MSVLCPWLLYVLPNLILTESSETHAVTIALEGTGTLMPTEIEHCAHTGACGARNLELAFTTRTHVRSYQQYQSRNDSSLSLNCKHCFLGSIFTLLFTFFVVT